MLLKKFLIWAFWDQNMSPGGINNGKSDCFHTSHLTADQDSLKTMSLTAIVSNTLDKLKTQLADLHKILQNVFFFTKTNVIINSATPVSFAH